MSRDTLARIRSLAVFADACWRL